MIVLFNTLSEYLLCLWEVTRTSPPSRALQLPPSPGVVGALFTCCRSKQTLEARWPWLQELAGHLPDASTVSSIFLCSSLLPATCSFHSLLLSLM